MIGMQHTFKHLSGAIAVAAFAVVVAVPSALSMTVITDTLGGNGSPKATPDAFERAVAIHTASQGRQTQGVRFITDTLGGNGSPKTDVFERSVAIHEAQVAHAQAAQVAKSLQYNPGAYVNGGMSASVAQSNNQPPRASLPYAYGGMSVAVDQTGATQSATAGSTGSGFNWKLGGGIAAGLLLLLLLLGGQRPRQHRRSVRTA
jgi:hypothetical protein